MFIVLPPVTKYYKDELLASDILFKSLYEAIKDYCNVKILNFYDLKDFNMDDFCDGDHLNKKGAEKLTNMIRNEMGL